MKPQLVDVPEVILPTETLEGVDLAWKIQRPYVREIWQQAAILGALASAMAAAGLTEFGFDALSGGATVVAAGFFVGFLGVSVVDRRNLPYDAHRVRLTATTLEIDDHAIRLDAVRTITHDGRVLKVYRDDKAPYTLDTGLAEADAAWLHALLDRQLEQRGDTVDVPRAVDALRVRPGRQRT